MEPKGPKMEPKSDQNASKNRCPKKVGPRDAHLLRCNTFLEPFWPKRSLQGSILASIFYRCLIQNGPAKLTGWPPFSHPFSDIDFWMHFGRSLAPFGGLLAPFWSLRVPLGLHFGALWSTWGPFWLHFDPCWHPFRSIRGPLGAFFVICHISGCHF